MRQRKLSRRRQSTSLTRLSWAVGRAEFWDTTASRSAAASRPSTAQIRRAAPRRGPPTFSHTGRARGPASFRTGTASSTVSPDGETRNPELFGDLPSYLHQHSGLLRASSRHFGSARRHRETKVIGFGEGLGLSLLKPPRSGSLVIPSRRRSSRRPGRSAPRIMRPR